MEQEKEKRKGIDRTLTKKKNFQRKYDEEIWGSENSSILRRDKALSVGNHDSIQHCFKTACNS